MAFQPLFIRGWKQLSAYIFYSRYKFMRVSRRMNDETIVLNKKRSYTKTFEAS